MRTRWLRHPLLAALGVVLTVGASLAAPWAARAEERMPEFSNRSPAAWINSAPLSRAGLAGKVVLLEVFAAG
jgi:hypothetical protein